MFLFSFDIVIYFLGSTNALNKQFSRGDSIRSVGGQSIGGQSVTGQSIGSVNMSGIHPSKEMISTQTSVQEDSVFSEQSNAAVESSANNTLLHRSPSATS